MLQIKVGGMWMVQMSLVHLLSAYEAATQTTVLTQSTTVNQQQGILGLGASNNIIQKGITCKICHKRGHSSIDCKNKHKIDTPCQPFLSYAKRAVICNCFKKCRRIVKECWCSSILC